jgi:ferritin-like metal-binding protein YciE
MSANSLSDLLEDEIKDLYSAENQILKALPKLVKKASSAKLKAAFSGHLKQTEGHVKRLEEIGRILDITLSGKTCEAMKGLLKEGDEALKEDGPEPVVDSALIGAARRVEHYEMAAYCATRGMAQHLGENEVAKLLEETTNEEKAADDKLKDIAQDEVFPHAAEAGEREEEDEQATPISGNGRSTK